MAGNIAIKDKHSVSAPQSKEAEARFNTPTPCPDFAQLLPRGKWLGLPAAIRRRFSRSAAGNSVISYHGMVVEQKANAAGWLITQAARLIGAPLPFSVCGPAAVTITSLPAHGSAPAGQIWSRQYGRQAGFPQVIHSVKRFAGPTGLEEYLGMGIGIALRLEADAQSLDFISDHYFLMLFGTRLRLPRWLSPGDLRIGHIAKGEHRFAFTLKLSHRLFGVMIEQVCLFEDEEKAPC
ncbi:DUF4166 domain-containing protein [Alterisphingorhabdus coralli]|uniref:DUF4166 domain-containing protein n=1 Tax=Alterisphingorhabdus coralli TaxID=3071408 RepID=A0AA97F6K0_9SPHN|nr:DUF4166 domain-containing protein [Parasphingorhabdus sp. SCSIO 66989]WOE75294.1 DUF4166 domain-containing protein [Parasphingorhabdus sp. SCSIO 66989]